jgi:glycosyltransferase involved in cell wall biosynthesis
VLTKADPRELADAAIALLLDPERRAVMARAARPAAEASFSAARQVQSMVAHYARLLAGAGPA